MTQQKFSTRRSLAVAVALLATTALAACGGSGSDGAATDNAVASLNSTPPGADGSGAADAGGDTFEATTDAQEAAAQYESCMKEQGIDMKMTILGDEGVSADDAGEGNDVGSDNSPDLTQGDYEAAEKECSKYLDAMLNPPDLTPEQEAAMADADARFKKCIEDQGLDPDLLGMGADDSAPSTDVDTSNMPTNEEIDAAFSACMYVYEDDPKLEELFSSDTGN